MNKYLLQHIFLYWTEVMLVILFAIKTAHQRQDEKKVDNSKWDKITKWLAGHKWNISTFLLIFSRALSLVSHYLYQEINHSFDDINITDLTLFTSKKHNYNILLNQQVTGIPWRYIDYPY